jgi:hypothetical protein
MQKSPLILRNPKQTVVEFMYGSMITIFQPGETKPLDWETANHALTMVNTGLIDVTSEMMNPQKTTSVVPENETDYTLMGLPQLLKLAKERGIKTKFGMKKVEVISLLL